MFQLKQLHAQYTFDTGTRKAFSSNYDATLAALSLLEGRTAIREALDYRDELSAQYRKARQALKDYKPSELHGPASLMFGGPFKLPVVSDENRVERLQQQETIALHRQEILTLVLGELFTNEEANPQADLERINNLPSVVAVGTYESEFSAVVRATTTYHKKLYFMGDWLIRFHAPRQWISSTVTVSDNRRDAFETIEVRTATRDGWPREAAMTSYPYYGDGGTWFCYGSNLETINGHLLSGHVLQAVMVASSTLCSVNLNDLDKIPDAFYPIT